MKKKLILLFIIILILLTVGIAAIFYFDAQSQTETKNSDDIGETYRRDAQEFSESLLQAFNAAVEKAELSDNSLVAVNTYIGKEEKPEDVHFNDENKLYFMASSVKPILVTAFLKVTDIKDLDHKIPFKFVNDNEIKSTIALEISSYLTYGTQIDQFLIDHIASQFEEGKPYTVNEVLNIFLNDEKFVNLEFKLSDVIKSILGPSSNWGVTLLRHYLGIANNTDESGASDILENYINEYLKANNRSGEIHFSLSTRSVNDKLSNTAIFGEFEFLIEEFFRNNFEIPEHFFELMKSAMQNIASDPIKYNRRHEIKSIAKDVFDSSAYIIEKSGYIGLNRDAVENLAKEYGWDEIPKDDDQLAVLFNFSTFARIYLNNGWFVQMNYTITSPIVISTEPLYELNPDYVNLKNKVFGALEDELRPIFVKYKEFVKTI